MHLELKLENGASRGRLPKVDSGPFKQDRSRLQLTPLMAQRKVLTFEFCLDGLSSGSLGSLPAGDGLRVNIRDLAVHGRKEEKKSAIAELA